MKLKIYHSFTTELRIVQESLADLDFIINNNYELWLPRGINKESSKAAIKRALATEFDPGFSEQIHARLMKFYKTYASGLEQFAKIFTSEPPAVLRLTLTRYGTGGYYELPDRIIINLRQTFDTPESVLVHEFVHLLIEEPVVNKFELDHSTKEGLVDYLILYNSLLHRILPKYNAQDQTTPPSAKILELLAPHII